MKTKTSQYHGVSFVQSLSGAKGEMGWKKGHPWKAQFMINGRRFQKAFATEREAALCVDKWRIENGLEPINILKRAA